MIYDELVNELGYSPTPPTLHFKIVSNRHGALAPSGFVQGETNFIWGNPSHAKSLYIEALKEWAVLNNKEIIIHTITPNKTYEDSKMFGEHTWWTSKH